MKVTLPHYYDFGAERDRIGGELVLPTAWDAARETDGPFGLPETREEWERAAADDSLRARALDIAALARRLEADRICSYGVGSALLELNLARAGLRLTCADYAPRTVARLRGLFPEAELVEHDLIRDIPLAGDLHLMHRIDSELSTREWRSVFPRFREPILVVPTLLLDLERALKEIALRVIRPRATRAGWVRTEAALRALWRPTHDDEWVTVGGAPAFLLTRRIA